METNQAQTLFNFLPGWTVNLSGNKIKLRSPDAKEARSLLTGGRERLQGIAQRLNVVVEILEPGSNNPLAQFGTVVETLPLISTKLPSYGAARIKSDADLDTVLDFIKGKKGEDLIVTVTSMVNDKCLVVNDLQALDRGGSWTAQDWIGIDFKTLWRDSFRVGNHNYYGELLDCLERDLFIPDFLYRIRRPSGALAEYSSTYHYVENFLGAPARIAVSVPGNWRIISSAPDGSEVV